MHLLNRSVPLKIDNNILNLILDSLVVSCVFFLCVCVCIHIFAYMYVCVCRHVCVFMHASFCVCVWERKKGGGGDLHHLQIIGLLPLVAHIGSRLQTFQLFVN